MRESWRRMLALIVRRLVSLIPILIVVSFVVFMLTELVPGDAATTLAGGADATPERIAEVRTQLGLDRPVLERYGDWLVDAVQLDFGSSLLNQGGPSIAEEIKERIPVTFSVAFAGLLVSILIGIPLGILSGIRPGAKVDRASVTATSIGLAIPSFVVALFLITALATLAMPGSGNFIGEILILFGTFENQLVYGLVAAVGVVLAAVYMIRVYQGTMHGPVGPAVDSRDIDRMHLSALVPLVALVIALGLYPNFVVHRTEQATTGAIAEARVAGAAQDASAAQEVSAIP